MILTLELQTASNANVYRFIKGTMWPKYEPDWSKGRRNLHFTRIFTFDLEHWFKVTTYSLFIDSVQMKYEANRA